MSKRDSHTVSVLIPVYNDAKGINTTLKSLVKQRFTGFEMLPIDNNSTDETSNVITNLTSEYPAAISKLQRTDVQSSYAARNTGIEHASGDILLFLDADMWVDETWIEDMVDTLNSNNYDYLGCNVNVVADNPNFWERYEQSFSFPVETYLQDKQFAPTSALAVRREVFEEVGLFDEHLESGGDKEFGQRVHHAGFSQGYAGDITAYHPARDSWKALRSTALRIGRGREQTRRYHQELDEPNPLHPFNYLPPSPFRLRRRFSGHDVSAASLVGFYLLEYLLKLIQSYGMLRETLRQRRSTQENPE